MRFLVNSCPAALTLYAEVVAVHPDPEEAVLAPVSSVAVPADPVLNFVLCAPPNYRNLVILGEDELRLRVNASGVGLPLVRRLDSAAYWPPRKDLCLHALCALDKAVLSRLPHRVLLDLHTARTRATVADLLVRTGRSRRILGLEVLTALLGKPEFHGVLINVAGVAALAVSSVIAVDDHLGGESEVRPGSVSGDVDAICQRTCGCLNPTVTAVVRRPLIFCPRKVVYSGDVSPIPILRQILEVKILMRSCRFDGFRDELCGLSFAPIPVY